MSISRASLSDSLVFEQLNSTMAAAIAARIAVGMVRKRLMLSSGATLFAS